MRRCRRSHRGSRQPGLRDTRRASFHPSDRRLPQHNLPRAGSGCLVPRAVCQPIYCRNPNGWPAIYKGAVTRVSPRKVLIGLNRGSPTPSARTNLSSQYKSNAFSGVAPIYLISCPSDLPRKAADLGGAWRNLRRRGLVQPLVGKQPKQLLIDLALQGGGAHGAFAWGVLDRLLEDHGFGSTAFPVHRPVR